MGCILCKFVVENPLYLEERLEQTSENDPHFLPMQKIILLLRVNSEKTTTKIISF